MRFKDKTVFVTGAAGGIGEVTARMFAAEGARVVLADLLEDEGVAVTQAINETGGDASFVKLDVSSETDWRHAIASAEKVFGAVHVVVSNAGISGMVPDHENVDYMDRLTSVHIRGTFLAIRHGAKAIVRAGGGSIVTVSSVAAYCGLPGLHMGYAAVKAGVLGMTRCAAGEYARSGVRVNAIVPGLLPPMRTSVVSADPAMRKKFFETVPLGGTGGREDAANAILFLASDAAAYVTGAEVLLDGGFLAYRC
ncbi:SDR family NAD(P)-dependent oxidoreductase [Cupriavidus taiwanensis]|uniref:SDR family NAD(P)-dependent oxidoreductase n=1 Tax=Cupriavidus taiwanensis TaxID=164546 RepID=UPI00254107BB|nr:SDR family NAD(P)-dependent oxidoreductase [Cupriavidus taiwanensis]MDK3022698.1 SDR family NAD(P)-dependent oxidoreductase [Cupriavidus taiwanensis]